MKKFKNNLFVVLILYVLLPLSTTGSYFFLHINVDARKPSDFLLEDKKFDPKNAGYWKITPIDIDDADPTKNWAITKASYEWCQGSGTLSDPYVIENVTVNGNDAQSCIAIKNSNEYFIIRNCTLYNSSLGLTGDRDGGIKLINATNGKIIKNHCHNNNFGGLLLFSGSNNNSIINNIVEYNLHDGVWVRNCNSVNIIGNNLSNNGDRGVYTSSSNNITITNNIVYSNELSGIGLSNSNNNFFLHNIVYDNRDYGISLSSSHYNLIKGNIIFLNYVGIRPYTCEHNIIRENIVYQNEYSGIALIFNNQNNTIFNNSINNNYQYGIKIFPSSNYNKIYMNYVRNSGISNSYDEGTNNKWDNGSIGNYWDDYTGSDLNHDGIGDIPYNISGPAASKDRFPIWEDRIEKPAEESPLIILIVAITSIAGGIGLTGVVLILLRKKKRKFS